ncbi:recombination protein RecR [Boudabousia marimammalium]|uniref:Recombination protein RecR n=1 Tax=Boudabousia marimammalium TaxID=156892 RepID=A0A1Q5PSS4_9ACTO|nr:recombination protein RecR [Boudabousia marimammalium]
MFDGAIQDLIDELSLLPGVGPKSAQRIAFHLLEADAEDINRLTSALNAVKTKVTHCEICGNLAEAQLCSICQDERRDRTVICVVEQAQDIQAIERTHAYRGLYHVLGGAIDPMRGIGPDQLRIRGLLSRLTDGSVTEVVIATDPNIEGEATATYLARMLESVSVPASRLALGLPVGGDLEYADEVTLGRAFEGRRRV